MKAKSKKNKTKAASDSSAEILHILEILHKWGVHTLGQLAALDKQAVGERLGPLAMQLWERANAKRTRLLKLVQPKESLAEAFEFENDIETIDPLLFMLRRFLQNLGVRLDALYRVAKELKLQIIFSDKTHYEHQFKIPEPTNNIEVLFRMLHTHLENFTSISPVIAVALEARAAKPAPQQFGLFETALRDPSQLCETLARLTGLLGEDRVGTPVLEETHRPDSFRMERFSWKTTDKPADAKSLPSCALRRFRFPAPASVLLAESKPVHLRAAELQSAVVDQRGPYLASGNWWDNTRWERAEWDLELKTGALCRAHSTERMWQLDGVYD